MNIIKRCPSCSHEIASTMIDFFINKSRSCPRCKTQLRYQLHYLKIILWLMLSAILTSVFTILKLRFGLGANSIHFWIIFLAFISAIFFIKTAILIKINDSGLNDKTSKK